MAINSRSRRSLCSLCSAALQAIEVVKQFPSVQMGAISEDPQLYALMAALLREHSQLYNIYVGYDDGSFIELDALDRAGPAVRAQLGAPEQAAYRLVTIAKRLLENGGNRHTTFLYQRPSVLTRWRF